MSDLSYMGGKGYGRGTGASKVQVNQWSGHLNDGRTVNMGRGPTKGNDGSCGHSGMAHAGSKPPTSGVPAHNPGKEMYTGRTQVRNPGGTRSWEPKKSQNYKGNPNSINVGRGPTKGNQQ